MAKLNTAVSVYRKEGISGLARTVRRRLAGTSTSAAYQDKVAEGTPRRLALIDAALPPGRMSVLDVGCNLGEITAHMANRGHWAVGVDSQQSLVDAAISRHARVANCAFMLMDVRPDDLASLPAFDVVLLLSVHHHWLMAHGPDTAGRMLRDLSERAGSMILFEGASRNVRYGDYPPNFVDNDEASVTAYLRGYLEHHVGDLFDRIDLLGKAPCVGEREPFRWSFGLYK